MSSAIGPVILITIVLTVVLYWIGWGTLEFQEVGLNYSFIMQSVENKPYSAGRYYIGVGNHFIKFPRMVRSINFVDDLSGITQGPALMSRTRDGLNVRLEVSFQYKLRVADLYQLYSTLGPTYENIFVRMAIEQLSTASTMYSANEFFDNRTTISNEMHGLLDDHFDKHAFARVPLFQLRTVHLPNEFEDAIQDTQVKEQEIQIAFAEQKQNRVAYETTVIQAEQKVQVLVNQAEAEAASILFQNDAYCRQYRVTQDLQREALTRVMSSAEWQAPQLLEYLKMRAVREHPSGKTTMGI